MFVSLNPRHISNACAPICIFNLKMFPMVEKQNGRCHTFRDWGSFHLETPVQYISMIWTIKMTNK